MTVIQCVGATPSSSTTPAITTGVSITTGNMGFATARFGSAATITSVVDNLGASWTVSTLYSGGGAGANAFAYRLNCPSGVTTVTWTFNAAQSAQLLLLEASNVLTSAAIDQTGTGATGTSTAPLAGAITTTNANEIIFGVISMGGTETYTQSGSWLIASGTGAPTVRAVIVYQEVTSIQTGVQPAVTGNSSQLWLAQAVSFIQNAPAAPAYVYSQSRPATLRRKYWAFRHHHLLPLVFPTVSEVHTSTATSSAGARATCVAQKNAASFNVAGAGAQGQNVPGPNPVPLFARTSPIRRSWALGRKFTYRRIQQVTPLPVILEVHTSTATGRTGSRASNVDAALHQSTATGSVGAQGVCVASRDAATFNVGGIGAQGQNVLGPYATPMFARSSPVRRSWVLGRHHTYKRIQNTITLGLPPSVHTSSAQSSSGARAVCVATRVANCTNVTSSGTRSQNVETTLHNVAVTSRAGAQDTNASTALHNSTATGRAGATATVTDGQGNIVPTTAISSIGSRATCAATRLAQQTASGRCGSRGTVAGSTLRNVANTSRSGAQGQAVSAQGGDHPTTAITSVGARGLCAGTKLTHSTARGRGGLRGRCTIPGAITIPTTYIAGDERAAVFIVGDERG